MRGLDTSKGGRWQQLPSGAPTCRMRPSASLVVITMEPLTNARRRAVLSEFLDRACWRARFAYERECSAAGINPSARFLMDAHFHDLEHKALTDAARQG